MAHAVQAVHGIPRPLTQVNLFDEDGLIGRVDDYWPRHGTVGETDGLLKYDDDPTALRREKLRQERIERTGLQVVRVTYEDLRQRAASTANRYREAFARGEGRRPRVVLTAELLDPWEAREAYTALAARDFAP
jgi:hypothetical protein